MVFNHQPQLQMSNELDTYEQFSMTHLDLIQKSKLCQIYRPIRYGMMLSGFHSLFFLNIFYITIFNINHSYMCQMSRSCMSNLAHPPLPNTKTISFIRFMDRSDMVRYYWAFIFYFFLASLIVTGVKWVRHAQSIWHASPWPDTKESKFCQNHKLVRHSLILLSFYFLLFFNTSRIMIFNIIYSYRCQISWIWPSNIAWPTLAQYEKNKFFHIHGLVGHSLILLSFHLFILVRHLPYYGF